MLQSALTLMEQTSDSGPLSTGLSQTHPPQPGPPAFGGLARTLLWSETASLLLPSVVAVISLGLLSPWHGLLTNSNVYMGAVGYHGTPLYNVLGIKYVIGGQREPSGDTGFNVPFMGINADVTI